MMIGKILWFIVEPVTMILKEQFQENEANSSLDSKVSFSKFYSTL